jgi:hypothetical protein
MKYRYGKFVPGLLDELDMDELMSKLSDLLLASGFNDPYFSGSDDERCSAGACCRTIGSRSCWAPTATRSRSSGSKI